jgi:transcription antitermination factor NusG
MSQVELIYNWYAIRVKSRAEKKVNAQLTDQGIESFLPLQRRLRRWSDRKKWVDMPLISGYVFVHISRKEYERVLNTFNVVCYIYFEGKAAVIRDKDILLLKRMLGQSELELEVTIENLKPGQLVEVISGPLCGVVGELIEFKGRNKVALRIPPLGYMVMVEAPEKTLIPFGSEIQLS